MAGSGWRIDLVVPATAQAAFEGALEPLGGALVIGLPRDDGLVALQVYLQENPEETVLRACLASAAEAAGTPVPEARIAALANTDWVAESQSNLPAIRAGRFYLHGSHVTAPPPTASIPLLIDANVAFGTGRHETTRGCLLALEGLAKAGLRPRRLLDLGCGSGILALGMAKLWRRPVLAADNDPAAVEVARINARINRSARWVRPLVSESYQHRLLKAVGPFDLIVANILAEPLAAMAADLRAHLAPGGRAVLSGLLVSQERLVLNPHRAQGLSLLRRLRLGEWSTLVLRR